MTVATQTPVAPGFARPVHDGQQVFRAVLAAMSRPGSVVPLPAPPAGHGGLGPSTAAVLLALADLETPLWLSPELDTDEARGFLRFHCGSPITADPAEAAFAICGDPAHLPDAGLFALGTPAYPDRSATLILRVPKLIEDRGMVLSGPGIDGQTRLDVPGLSPAIIASHQDNHAIFPMGFDIIFAGPDALACLPRTTQIITEKEAA